MKSWGREGWFIKMKMRIFMKGILGGWAIFSKILLQDESSPYIINLRQNTTCPPLFPRRLLAQPPAALRRKLYSSIFSFPEINYSATLAT